MRPRCEPWRVNVHLDYRSRGRGARYLFALGRLCGRTGGGRALSIRWGAPLIAAVVFMACAAIRAQTAYLHRFDGPLFVGPYINSVIRLNIAAAVCFVVAKVLP